jgi:hypothetical protein
MRNTPNISRALAFKCLPTDTDGDGDVDYNRYGPVSAGTPAWLPEGAVVYADFVNGRYYADGAETTLGAMWTEDAINYGPFNPVTDIDGSGLVAGFPILVGSADLIAEGFTVVLRATTVAPDKNVAARVMNLPDYTGEVWVEVDSTGSRWKDGSVVSIEAGATGSCVIAARFAHADQGASVAGGTVFTAAEALNTFNVLMLTQASGASIQSVAFYAPVADAALPTLSALS